MNPYIIGVTGGSGSGKTSFIRALKNRFERDRLCVISQDDYYRPSTEQKKDASGIYNFDLPESIDREAFYKDLQQLIRGEVVCRPEYTFNNGQKTPKLIEFFPAKVLIVEGIFLFHFEELRKLLNLKIFLHAKENLKVIRRIKRDKEERNYPLEDVLYRYEHHVLPTFEKYIQPYMDEADLIINNNQQFDKGLEVLTGFIHHRLFQQD